MRGLATGAYGWRAHVDEGGMPDRKQYRVVAALRGLLHQGQAIGRARLFGVDPGVVHIHRNVLGDSDPLGGASDIDNTVQRWLNPVARVVLTVSN